MDIAQRRALAFVQRAASRLRRGSAGLRDRVLLKRILVIRGGAIGDFVLTLPAIRALRIAFPESYIEVLGYRHIVELALNPLHADAARSIESAAMASFFAREGELPSDLAAHFASFDLILSYLFDPDRIFAANLARAGAQRIVVGPGKLDETEHAAAQLARPLSELHIPIENLAAKIPASGSRTTTLALHPGSGSRRKNWPLDRWIALAQHLRERRLLIIGGEADVEAVNELRPFASDVAVALPLPQLAEKIAGCATFIGHDSGISHVAAATGTPCLLLFGPTEPCVWAPQNEAVRVLRADTQRMDEIDVARVINQLDSLL